MIEIEKNQDFWMLTLNRPEVHNAFHPEMIEQIRDFYLEASEQKNIRFVLLKANGKSFSAGADLNWMKSMVSFSKEENRQDALALFDLFHAVYSCKQVCIALAHGNVFGGGLGLLATQDMVLADRDTKFCFSEVKWGLSPATISPFLTTKVATSHLAYAMMSGDVFDYDGARNMGLVHGNLEDWERLQGLLYSNGPEAMKVTKKIIRMQQSDPLTFREDMARIIADRRVSKEGQAGLKFFLNKEEPYFKGKIK